MTDKLEQLTHFLYELGTLRKVAMSYGRILFTMCYIDKRGR
jgi:hypothetical protein